MEGRITASSWNEFRAFFLDGIRVTCIGNNKRFPFYEFCGLEKGVRCITCGDDESLLFLRESLQHFNMESHHSFLSVVPRGKMPKWKTYSVLLPISSEHETFEDQTTILMYTNSHIGSENWFFHPSVNVEAPVSANSRVNIFVSMNDTDESRLKKVNYYVYYGLDKIKMYKVVNDSIEDGN